MCYRFSALFPYLLVIWSQLKLWINYDRRIQEQLGLLRSTGELQFRLVSNLYQFKLYLNLAQTNPFLFVQDNPVKLIVPRSSHISALIPSLCRKLEFTIFIFIFSGIQSIHFTWSTLLHFSNKFLIHKIVEVVSSPFLFYFQLNTPNVRVFDSHRCKTIFSLVGLEMPQSYLIIPGSTLNKLLLRG